MGWYIVDTVCPRCGQIHRLSGNLQLDRGRTQQGTVAELYGEDQPLPQALAGLVDDLVWCGQAGDYIGRGGRQRVMLTPRAEE